MTTEANGDVPVVEEVKTEKVKEIDDGLETVEIKQPPTPSSSSQSTAVEDIDIEEIDKKPLCFCKLIVKYPTASFLIGLSVFFLSFLISGALIVLGYDLLPIEFTKLPLKQNNDLYLQRYYAWRYKTEDDSNLIERIPTSILISGNRTKAGDKLELIFETKDGSNIFTKTNLQAIQAIQNQVLGVPNYASYCRVLAADSSTCRPPISPISYFDGTYANENPAWNDTSFSSISSILYSAYMNSNQTTRVRQFLGKDAVVTASEVSSSITRSIIEFGYPLESGGTEDEQLDKIKNFLGTDILGILWDHHDNPPAGMRFYFYSFQLYTLEILAQALKDMALAAGSFAFIFIFVCIQTQSAWLGAWAIFSILGSFVIANLIYRCIVGYIYFGFFHVLSIFIILGIGADDIFILIDTWRDSAHKKFPSLEHRFSFVYRRSAVAMAVTSSTTMAAFLVSATSPFIAIHSFGAFSAILVFVNYISVITFYPTVLMMHYLKTSKCCVSNKNIVDPTDKAEEGQEAETEEGDDKDKNVFVRFFKGPYFRFISHRVAKWVILVGFLILLGVAIYFDTQLEPSNEPLILYIDSHNFAKADQRRLYSFMPSNLDPYVTVILVWGLKPQDLSQCHFSNISCTGTTVFDDSFDMNSASAQLSMSSLCKKLQSPTTQEITDLHILISSSTNATSTNCFMTNFEAYLSTLGLSIPLNETNVKPFMQSRPSFYGSPLTLPTNFNRYFEVMIMYWLTSGYTYAQTDDFIIYNPLLGEIKTSETRNFTVGVIPAYWGTKLQFAGIEVNTTLNRRALGYTTGLPVASKWDDFMVNQLKTFPSGANDGFQTSRVWEVLETQKVLVVNALMGIGIGIALALVILSLTAMNIIIALIATLSIAGVTSCVIAVIHIAGWKLGVLESLNMSLVVGLAVDYVVHFAEAYNRSPHYDRLRRTQDALEQVGVSVLSGATTTLGAAFFMMLAQILFFVQFGIFMFCTILFSFLFSIGFFCTFMVTFGPQGNFGSFRCKCCGSGH